MSDPAELLIEFRKSFERLENARSSGDADSVAHAERNFQMCSEIVAKNVPAMIGPLQQLRSGSQD